MAYYLYLTTLGRQGAGMHQRGLDSCGRALQTKQRRMENCLADALFVTGSLTEVLPPSGIFWKSSLKHRLHQPGFVPGAFTDDEL